MFSFYDIQPGYRVWLRPNQENSLWEAMPYAPRPNYESAIKLLEVSKAKTGDRYEYQVVPCGQRPAGMCVPY